MTDEPGQSEGIADHGATWISDAQAVDPEWVEFSVTTPIGTRVHYRVPQRTLFDEIDREYVK